MAAHEHMIKSFQGGSRFKADDQADSPAVAHRDAVPGEGAKCIRQT